jgi:hypothetical protein
MEENMINIKKTEPGTRRVRRSRRRGTRPGDEPMKKIHKRDGGGELATCPSKPKVPSDGEVEALEALRAIKEQARSLKRELALLHEKHTRGDAAAVSTIQKKLSRLRAEWNSWEKRRRSAARERMILLGHEDGPA